MAKNKIDSAHHEDWLRQDETQTLIRLLLHIKEEYEETLASGSTLVYGDAIKTHENTVREITNQECMADIIDLIQDHERWE